MSRKNTKKHGSPCKLGDFNSSTFGGSSGSGNDQSVPGGSSTYKDVGKCIQACQKPFEELSHITSREFNTLQSGIQGCQKSCMDNVMPKLEAVKAGLSCMGRGIFVFLGLKV